MSVKVYEKRGYLYLVTIQNRKYKWESLGIQLSKDPQTKKEQMKTAEIARAKRELQMVEGEWNIKDTLAGKQLLINYILDMAQGKDKKNHIYRLSNRLKEYRDGGRIQLVAVNAKWVQDFQDWLLYETGLSQMTVSHYSTALRQVFNKAVRERILTHNPCELIKGIQRPETNKDVLTAEEIKVLANTECTGLLGAEVKRAFLFACMTGLRQGDIRGKEKTKGQGALIWGDIETREITQYNKCKHWLKVKMNKVQRYIEIPLNNTAWELISPVNFPTKMIFEQLALSNTHTDKYIKKWVEKAGINKTVGMHTARRTFATLLQERGTDIYTIKRLTGHKIDDVTGLYAKSTQLLHEAVLKLDDVLSGEQVKDIAGGAV